MKFCSREVNSPKTEERVPSVELIQDSEASTANVVKVENLSKNNGMMDSSRDNGAVSDFNRPG